MQLFLLFPASMDQRMVTNVIADGCSLDLVLHLVSSDCWPTDNVDIFERYSGVFPLRHDSGFEDDFGTGFGGQIIAQRAGNIFWADNGEPQVDQIGK